MSALLLTASMPPHGYWALAILGFVPFILAQYRILPRRASSLGSAIAIGGLIGLYILQAFVTLPGAPWYMKLLPVIFGGFVFLADQMRLVPLSHFGGNPASGRPKMTKLPIRPA